MKDCKPSEKALSAWLDGELGADEANRLEQLLEQDPGLRRHVEELREVRALVRRAFDAEAPTGGTPRTSRSWRPRAVQALAAGVLLVIGAGIGWTLRAPAATPLDDELTASGALVLRTVQPAAAATNNLNILLNITSGDHARLRAALDKTEKLLQHYQRLHRSIRLEVVVNSRGLDLLRADTSPYVRRIREMQERYGNLTFIACRNTLALLKAKQGAPVHLLPGVVVGPPALEHVMTRLEQGWAYIKV